MTSRDTVTFTRLRSCFARHCANVIDFYYIYLFRDRSIIRKADINISRKGVANSRCDAVCVIASHRPIDRLIDQ